MSSDLFDACVTHRTKVEKIKDGDGTTIFINKRICVKSGKETIESILVSKGDIITLLKISQLGIVYSSLNCVPDGDLQPLKYEKINAKLKEQ